MDAKLKTARHEMVKQACLLTAVTNTARSSGMDGPLALAWRIECITPPYSMSSLEILSEPRLWHE